MRTIFILLMLCGFIQAQERHPLDNMPLVPSDIHGAFTPEPKRSENVRYYLKSSVLVVNGNIRGSATICHYDKQKNIAYLISCGHLFNGTAAPSDSQPSCSIVVFYKNNVKLEKPQKFATTVICHNADEDISFMSFTPDWEIDDWFPIAPLDYPLKKGNSYESTGCDEGKEVASYTVQLSSGITSGRNLVSIKNSPRPGRSGGALLSSDGYYLAIVWGTSEYSGAGEGYYVPLRRIHAYANQYKETSFLLSVTKNNILEQVKIIDLTGKNTIFHKNFIPNN